MSISPDSTIRPWTATTCRVVRAPEGPPLLLGGEGPRMLRLAARYADLWNTGYMGQPETIAEPMSRIEAACREAGRDPADAGRHGADRPVVP